MNKLPLNIIAMIVSTTVGFVTIIKYITGDKDLPTLLGITNITIEDNKKNSPYINQSPAMLNKSLAKKKQVFRPMSVSSQELVEVIIPVCNTYPKATVYSAEGKYLGITPYETLAPIGSQLKLVLKTKNSKKYKDTYIDLTIKSIRNDQCHWRKEK